MIQNQKRKTFPFRPKVDLFEKLQKQAEKDGISINSWMNMKLKKILFEE